MPCLDEAETLASCIRKAQAFFAASGVRGEVVVADNGSVDASCEIALQEGARLVRVEKRGYGSALRGGIEAARGRFFVMGDADDSYDFSALMSFLDELRKGHDLVMGNRFRGGILPGAMPRLHRYLGNPLLSFLGRLFFRSSVGDFHCGMRGFTREAFAKMDLRTTGMEFASEMVVKATLLGLSIAEVPSVLTPDGRTRPPHLHSWRDGWRHLRFLLLYSPRWLFLYPGVLLIAAGLAAMLLLLPGPHTIRGVTFDVHTLLYAAAAIVLGFQSLSFAVMTKVFAANAGLLPRDHRLERVFHVLSLEVGLLFGALLSLAGVVGTVAALISWRDAAFGDLTPSRTLRMVVPAVLALMLGAQIMLMSFFLGVLGMGREENGASVVETESQ
jgi:hypothetical protein